MKKNGHTELNKLDDVILNDTNTKNKYLHFFSVKNSVFIITSENVYDLSLELLAKGR